MLKITITSTPLWAAPRKPRATLYSFSPLHWAWLFCTSLVSAGGWETSLLKELFEHLTSFLSKLVNQELIWGRINILKNTFKWEEGPLLELREANSYTAWFQWRSCVSVLVEERDMRFLRGSFKICKRLWNKKEKKWLFLGRRWQELQ